LKTNSFIKLNRQKRPPAVLGEVSKSSPIGKESSFEIPGRIDGAVTTNGLKICGINNLSDDDTAVWKRNVAHPKKSVQPGVCFASHHYNRHLQECLEILKT
jgi:hypothetical protein